MDAGIIIAAIAAIASVVVAVINNFSNKKTNNKIDHLGQMSETAFKDIMKRDITDLYYRRKEGQWLWQYERESLDAEYAGYKEVHGNTFIDDLYEEMRNWEVKR